MNVAEMKLLRWMCDTRKYRIKNEEIRGKTEAQDKRGRGKPRKILKEIVRKDINYLELTEDLAQNRTHWHSRIYTPHMKR
ncbi:hypothetical protein DVH24_018775 [Malus domestica]|uniref:Uncharacterized protein n=1 Tax=Malus domestica TaxID=3750 RepID=A0A498HL27_MALDO|nr:hypothetical protein DVH24_018775 [Malus domestica]